MSIDELTDIIKNCLTEDEYVSLVSSIGFNPIPLILDAIQKNELDKITDWIPAHISPSDDRWGDEFILCFSQKDFKHTEYFIIRWRGKWGIGDYISDRFDLIAWTELPRIKNNLNIADY